NRKDQSAVMLMSDIVPQDESLNGEAWLALERFERGIAKKGWNVYIFAGTYGIQTVNGTPREVDQPSLDGTVSLSVPYHMWKIILIVPPDAGPEDLTAKTDVIAVDFPNDPTATPTWSGSLTTVDAIEKQIYAVDGVTFDFFSNVPL